MPRLKAVWLWGAPQDPDEKDDDVRAFVAASRPFCEWLSASIREHDLVAQRSELRALVFSEDRITTRVLDLLTTREGPLVAHIHLTRPFASLDFASRLNVLKQDFRTLLGPVAVANDWPEQLLEKILDRAESLGEQFTWESPWKSNRSRQLRARIEGSIRADGKGRVRLVVVDRDGKERLRTAELEVWATAEEFGRVAKELRWTETHLVSCPRITDGPVGVPGLP